MNNLALRVFWANSPMPINEKIENPDVILNVLFGNVLVLGSGSGDAAVKSVNTKTGDVVLNAEDVGADKTGTAQEFANQAALNLENEVNDLKKLIENLGGGSSVEWVPVEQIGFLNTQAVEHALVGEKSLGIELARIDGNLWIRGMLNHKYYGYANPIFTIRDKRYKVFAGDLGYAPIAFLLFATGSNNSVVQFMSPQSVYDEQTAIDVDQILTCNYTFPPGYFYIAPQAVGKLVLP